MLSSRDRHIIDDLVEFKGLSINQVGKMWFPNNEYNYYYSRMRLKKLENKGYIKSLLFEEKKIYYSGESKPDTTMHRMVLLDFYSCLVGSGAKIKDYKFEYRWLDGKYKSDGIFVVEYEGIDSIIVVECDFTHKTDLKKYHNIYDSGVWKDKFGEFPWVVVVNKNGEEYKYTVESEWVENLIYLDFDMKGFNKVLTLLG